MNIENKILYEVQSALSSAVRDDITSQCLLQYNCNIFWSGLTIICINDIRTIMMRVMHDYEYTK